MRKTKFAEKKSVNPERIYGQLVEKVQQEFGADIEQAENMVKALQKAVDAARATQLPVFPRVDVALKFSKKGLRFYMQLGENVQLQNIIFYIA